MPAATGNSGHGPADAITRFTDDRGHAKPNQIVGMVAREARVRLPWNETVGVSLNTVIDFGADITAALDNTDVKELFASAVTQAHLNELPVSDRRVIADSRE